ncbi:hypothetical protein PHYSODRAFT_513804 [Phytophthora sojae]|uniref:Uncharacterized protein n=1 Tax=Phytophthora sojae (strain P6497) TaxID=1094619 RepID=G4ZRJ4_PHYSP|nr:hypothetical protein PHYSODRAFT_513804 [Phytophthora sojae]EGZ14147.1 hypothetical protein PHYSODRAFT_513804 [Phytophthora sojae]|eukprot:XP_009531576.1 hypothetical protein PHYSODRAFT_513804 [Phytophthora sojae]
MESSRACAETARRREQERQERYYDRKVRRKRVFEVGDRVWFYKPPRGPKATKLVHKWLAPVRIVEPVGYDNYLVEREDVEHDPEQYLAHASFLVSYHQPATLLEEAAADIEAQLEHEGALELDGNDETDGASGGAATAPVRAAPAAGTTKRRRRTVASTTTKQRPDEDVVELRRRRRNAAGQYVLEYEVRPVQRDGGRRRRKNGGR